MQERIKQELALLRRYYKGIKFVGEGQWVFLPQYGLPQPWQPSPIPIPFQIPTGYPGTAPYGFYAPANLTYSGAQPENANPAPNPPPFDGDWLLLSWAPQDWRPTADVMSGSNLWGWCRSFFERFKDGR